MNINGRYRGLFEISEANLQILGCGGIGSYTAVNLAKMGGINFGLYDNDIVEAVNVGVSAYGLNDINHYKVGALSAMIQNVNPKAKIMTSHRLFSEKFYKPGGNDIVLLSFDSMESRKDAVEIIVANKAKALIDSRMGAETFIMYIFLNPTVEKYKQYWHRDEDGDDEPCNARATSYCSSMAGAFAANAVRKIIMRDQPIQERIMFHFPSMLLKFGM